jgi:hypothetical protein
MWQKAFWSDFRWPDICLKKLNEVPKPWYNSRSSGQDVIMGSPECQTEIRSYITVIIFISMIAFIIIIVFSYYGISRNLNSYTISLLGMSSCQIALTYMAFPSFCRQSAIYSRLQISQWVTHASLWITNPPGAMSLCSFLKLLSSLTRQVKWALKIYETSRKFLLNTMASSPAHKQLSYSSFHNHTEITSYAIFQLNS